MGGQLYCGAAAATEATKVPATVTAADTLLVPSHPPSNFQFSSHELNRTASHSPPEQESDSDLETLEDESIASTDTTDSDDDDKSIEAINEVSEYMEYLHLCERGLVKNIIPMQPTVLSHVDQNRDIFRDNIFLGNDDVADGIGGLADPDELIDFGAEFEMD